jgi:hypothetical protein
MTAHPRSADLTITPAYTFFVGSRCTFCGASQMPASFSAARYFSLAILRNVRYI